MYLFTAIRKFVSIRSVTFYVLLLPVGFAAEQETANTHSHILSLTSHRIGIPFNSQASNYFAGYGINYDYRLEARPFWKFHYQHRLAGGVFRQPYYQNGLYATYSTGLGYKTGFGIDLWATAGLGYMHTFENAAVYEMNGNGDYEKVRDYGNPSVIVPAGFEIAYNLPKKYRIKALHLQYRVDIETLYSDNIPLFPHEYFLFGLKIQ